jgi:hypothetical protein
MLASRVKPVFHQAEICDFSGGTNSEKTKKNFSPCVKFRLVENRLIRAWERGCQWQCIFKKLQWGFRVKLRDFVPIA